MEKADILTVIESRYTDDCLKRRNWYMVSQAEAMLACYDGTSDGGTHMTMVQALRQNIPVWVITPRWQPVERFQLVKL